MPQRSSRSAALVSLLRRAAYACTFATTVWLLATLPLGIPGGLAVRTLYYVLRFVDYPVAVAAHLIPAAGTELFGGHRPPTPELLFRYLRLAVPVYLALSYFPSLAIASWHRWRRRVGGG